MIELADIIAPIAAPPAPPPYGWIVLGVAVFALILFFGLWFWLKRTRSQRLACAILKRAEKNLMLGKTDVRGTAFQIARAIRYVIPRQSAPASPPLAAEGSLRSSGAPTGVPLAGAKGEQGGFGCPSDRTKSPLSPLFQRGARLKSTATHDAEWADLTQALTHARFSPHPIDTQHAAQLLAQARQWIARTPC